MKGTTNTARLATRCSRRETELKDQTERVAALRRRLPLGRRVKNYEFWEGPPDLNVNSPHSGSTFNHDMRVEESSDWQKPAISVFVRKGEDEICHTYTTERSPLPGHHRAIDLFTPGMEPIRSAAGRPRRVVPGALLSLGNFIVARGLWADGRNGPTTADCVPRENNL